MPPVSICFGNVLWHVPVRGGQRVLRLCVIRKLRLNYMELTKRENVQRQQQGCIKQRHNAGGVHECMRTRREPRPAASRVLGLTNRICSATSPSLRACVDRSVDRSAFSCAVLGVPMPLLSPGVSGRATTRAGFGLRDLLVPSGARAVLSVFASLARWVTGAGGTMVGKVSRGMCGTTLRICERRSSRLDAAVGGRNFGIDRRSMCGDGGGVGRGDVYGDVVRPSGTRLCRRGDVGGVGRGEVYGDVNGEVYGVVGGVGRGVRGAMPGWSRVVGSCVGSICDVTVSGDLSRVCDFLVLLLPGLLGGVNT